MFSKKMNRIWTFLGLTRNEMYFKSFDHFTAGARYAPPKPCLRQKYLSREKGCGKWTGTDYNWCWLDEDHTEWDYCSSIPGIFEFF